MAKKKPGAKSKYSTGVAARILELAKAGKTDVEIAAAIGISPTTLNNWKGQHKDFFEALKKAKSVADDLVETALFQKAMGYSHTAVKFFYDPKQQKVVSQAYTERHAPDTTACIFWLKNRRPKQWRDVHKLEHTGKDGGPILQVADVAAVIDAVREFSGEPEEAVNEFH